MKTSMLSSVLPWYYLHLFFICSVFVVPSGGGRSKATCSFCRSSSKARTTKNVAPLIQLVCDALKEGTTGEKKNDCFCDFTGIEHLEEFFDKRTCSPCGPDDCKKPSEEPQELPACAVRCPVAVYPKEEDYIPCPADYCDYTYQCGETLYSCYIGYSPDDLGITEEAEETLGITTIEYCENYDSAGFKNFIPSNIIFNDENLVDCKGLCSVGAMVDSMSMNPEDVIGKFVCPNEKPLTRYTKVCTPSGEPGVGGCKKDRGGFRGCDEIDFCDFGDREATFEHFPPIPELPTPLSCYIYHEEKNTNQYRFEWTFDGCNDDAGEIGSESFQYEASVTSECFETKDGLSNGDVIEFTSEELQECASFTLVVVVKDESGQIAISECNAEATAQKKEKRLGGSGDANRFRPKKKGDLVATSNEKKKGKKGSCKKSRDDY